MSQANQTTILLVGVGQTGAQVLRQLLKNPHLKVLTLDPRENPEAVKLGIIEAVDFAEPFTPLTIDHIVHNAHPDLILLSSHAEELGLGVSPGIGMLADALRDELATIADVPVIEVARTTGR